MKDIKNYICESDQNGWTFFDNTLDYSGTELRSLNDRKVKWILVNTETEQIIGISVKDLSSFTDDFDGFEEAESAILSLKVGESYTEDGGINIYMRIKK